MKIKILKYSIIFNVRDNTFLRSVYIDRNGHIFDEKGKCCNCCKHM